MDNRHDAFSRLRVSNPTNLFDTQCQYDLAPREMRSHTANGGAVAHVPDESAVQLSTTTDPDSLAIRQSRWHMRYQPGKSHLIFSTFVLGAPVANVAKRVGLFDDSNGFFVELTEVGVAIVKRSSVSGSVVDTRVEQSDWELRTLDGLRWDNDLQLDTTKTQILVIDLQWLGVGRVRVGFDIDGEIVYAHEFNHANIAATTYITTANLPIRYEQRNTGVPAGTTDDFKQICCTCISEGGVDRRKGIDWTENTDPASPVSCPVGSITPIMSIQPKATFNSLENRGLILPLNVDVLNTSNNPAIWYLYFNGTLGGATFATGPSDSIAQVDIVAGTITGGDELEAGFVSAGRAKSAGLVQGNIDELRLILSRNIDNSDGDILTLAAQGIGGTATVIASMHWKEER